MVTCNACDKFLLVKSTKNVLRGVNFTNLKTQGLFAIDPNPRGWLCNLALLKWSSLSILRSLSYVLQGFCPGLSHGQKFGITYLASVDTTNQYESANKREPTILQSHSMGVVPNQSSEYSRSDNDNDNLQESSEGGSERESPRPSQVWVRSFGVVMKLLEIKVIGWNMTSESSGYQPSTSCMLFCHEMVWTLKWIWHFKTFPG